MCTLLLLLTPNSSKSSANFRSTPAQYVAAIGAVCLAMCTYSNNEEMQQMDKWYASCISPHKIQRGDWFIRGESWRCRETGGDDAYTHGGQIGARGCVHPALNCMTAHKEGNTARTVHASAVEAVVVLLSAHAGRGVADRRTNSRGSHGGFYVLLGRRVALFNRLPLISKKKQR